MGVRNSPGCHQRTELHHSLRPENNSQGGFARGEAGLGVRKRMGESWREESL